jgi:hypothetical protein
MFRLVTISVTIVIALFASLGAAQEAPYFVTYDHHLEDAGDLEISIATTVGVPRSGQRAFLAPYGEIEYGVKNWWTSALYLEGQSTSGDSTVFTGWRFENRFLPVGKHYRINPALYLEYEDINGASRIERETVGFAPLSSQFNSELTQSHARELEGKLILSSDVRRWNIAENFIVEHNLSSAEATEFGYAFGLSRALSKTNPSGACVFCRNNFSVGLEIYGGLGSSSDFGFRQTAHYAAPAVLWHIGDHSAIRVSSGIGLTQNSNPVLLRFAYSYEVEDFGRKSRLWFGRNSPIAQ